MHFEEKTIKVIIDESKCAGCKTHVCADACKLYSRGILVIKDGKVHLQAGAGLVADSDPATEWQETVNKGMAVMKAIEMAEKGLE